MKNGLEIGCWIRFLQKSYKRIMRDAGASDTMIGHAIEAAQAHRGPLRLKLKTVVAWPEAVEDSEEEEFSEEEEKEEERRSVEQVPEAAGGEEDVAQISAAMAGASVEQVPDRRRAVTPAERNSVRNGMQSVVVVPAKRIVTERSPAKKPKSLMGQWVRPPLPKLPRLQPSASNPPVIKKSIDDAGRPIDFQPTSAWNLLPGTARRRFDWRDDRVSGVVSLGYDPNTGRENFRVHVGKEDDLRGNDYLVVDDGEESAGRKEKRKSREQLQIQKERTNKLVESLERVENRGENRKRKFVKK